MRSLLKLMLLFVTVVLISSCTRTPQEVKPEIYKPGTPMPTHAECLSEAKYKKLIVQNCTSCHSAKLVCQNRMSRKVWDETITWMQTKHNLWNLSKRSRKRILDYLAEFQGIKKTRGGMYKTNYSPNKLWYKKKQHF